MMRQRHKSAQAQLGWTLLCCISSPVFYHENSLWGKLAVDLHYCYYRSTTGEELALHNNFICTLFLTVFGRVITMRPGCGLWFLFDLVSPVKCKLGLVWPLSSVIPSLKDCLNITVNAWDPRPPHPTGSQQGCWQWQNGGQGAYL